MSSLVDWLMHFSECYFCIEPLVRVYCQIFKSIYFQINQLEQVYIGIVNF